MNLLHLNYFYVVAKEGGFTKASKALRIQQPAISRMVKLLEDDIGFKLFEKVGRHVQLTKQGKEVFEYSQKIFNTVEDLNQSLGKINNECKGPLHFAASEPIASHFIPKILGSYLLKFPKVHPQIFSGPASLLLEKISDGKLEIGVFFHTPHLPAHLEVFEKKEIRFHLVVRKDLKKKPEVLESFIGSREIDDTSSKQFPTLEKLKKSYPKSKINISSNNLSAHKELVFQGLGVSILPDFLVKNEIKSGDLVDLYPNERFIYDMLFIKRQTAILTTSAAEFVRMCL